MRIAVLNYTYGTNGISLPADMPYAVDLLNEEQVAAFLNRHPEFRVVTPEVPFPQGMTVGEHGALSVPTRTGMDGFFLCAMQKQ